MSDGSDLDDRTEDSDGDEVITSEESIGDSDSEDDIADSDESVGGAEDIVDGLWMQIMGEDPGPVEIPFIAVSGPKHAPNPDAKPLEYYKLFFQDHFVDHIVLETNRYAQQWIEGHQAYLAEKPRSRVHYWIKQGQSTSEEFNAFFGIVLNMGLIRKPNIKAYWDSSNPSQYTPWFIEHFNRDRFQLYLKFLHFADSTNAPAIEHPDFKLYKIQPIIDTLQRCFLRYYHPYCNISIDESMIGYKGKTPHLRQYMRNKHHARFGVKLWALCDSKNGYTSFFEVYKGAQNPEDRGVQGYTYYLVVRLLTQSKFLNLGHHLGVDNFFSSPKLFLDLYAQQTTATGTVRANRKGLPKICIKARLRNHEVSERRKSNLLCVAYKDGGKTPILLSTVAKSGFIQVRNKRGQFVEKPRCVAIYNQSMGGVDMSDSKLYCYLSERRTMKWTTKVAFALFGRAVLNSYIIYEENTSDKPKLSRYSYMISLIEALTDNYRPPKVIRKRRTRAQIEANRVQPQVFQPPGHHVQQGNLDEGHDLVKLIKGKKRKCMAGHDVRVRTSWECRKCDIGLCPGCFGGYHRAPQRN